MKSALGVVAGAIVGGVLGYYAFFWVLSQGFYGMILPGGLLGLGAGVAKNKSLPLAIGCGVAALGLGLFTEWNYRPFNADDSFTYFLTHVFDNPALTLLMISVGGFLGFWIPFRRIEPASRQSV